MRPWKQWGTPPRIPLSLEQDYKAQDTQTSLREQIESDDANSESQPSTESVGTKSINGSEGAESTKSRSGSDYSFRDTLGRTFNTKSDAYPLPADMAEHERLSMQHRVFTGLFGGLYPAADMVDEVMNPQDNHTPWVLDLGTGSGGWAIDMAKKFPKAQVIGTDLAPPRLGNVTVPDNCSFEVHDANTPFQKWENTFDFVHCRAMASGLRDRPGFMRNVAKILRPGGVLILSNGTPQLVDGNGVPCRVIEEGKEGFRWIQKWYSACAAAFINNAKMRWTHDFHEIALECPYFDDVTSKMLLMPMGNWFPDETTPKDFQYAADINRYNFIAMVNAFVPLLISDGYRKEVIEYWRSEVAKELMEQKVRTCGAFPCTWCRRSDVVWTPVNSDSTGTV
ncbi:hypothetical protein FRC03_001275 [Tulasnella sp. 419]|nr:hypothetical protein FRC03_001275 [Tulasnella sp. 419]